MSRSRSLRRSLAASILLVVLPPLAFTFSPGSNLATRHTGCPPRYTALTRGKRSILYSSEDSQPSDSAPVEADDYSDAEDPAEESVEETPDEKESLVSSVLEDMASGGIGQKMAAATRSNINEALLALEKTFDEENPAMSSLINGVWSLRYAGGYSDEWALASPTRQLALFLYSGGYSPGLYALSLANSLPSSVVGVDDLEITIARSPQPRIEARVGVSLFGNTADVVVRADLDVESGVRILETYRDVEVLGRKTDVPEALRYSREMFVTYVDEDLLVVRDASGVPEVLVRKEKEFMKNWGVDPDVPGATA
mmetsp:Transcript_3039/g.5689  ORF Transcript_3039/g.5689 Transcript_3039/m.5689 type:complete len:311 (-) Transcript_3039:124-1056(-)